VEWSKSWIHATGKQSKNEIVGGQKKTVKMRKWEER
jgi:hypothetical protein